MQFYIIDPDPETNAALLPVYALKSVNLREGWQIVSDIGHRFGVAWEGQNKAYNPHHPLTRSYSHRMAYLRLLDHYDACLRAYLDRGIGEPTVWHAYAQDAFDILVATLFWKLPADACAETRHYLATRKAAHLTTEELERLAP